MAEPAIVPGVSTDILAAGFVPDGTLAAENARGVCHFKVGEIGRVQIR